MVITDLRGSRGEADEELPPIAGNDASTAMTDYGYDRRFEARTDGKHSHGHIG